MYGLYVFGLNGCALLYAHRCNSHKLECFTEFKTKNESTFSFGDVELCHGSDVVASDINIYSSTVLKICSGHSSDDSIAGLQVLLG